MMAANIEDDMAPGSNLITIRIPPLELEILGTRVQIDTRALNTISAYALSSRDAQMLRLALRLLGELSGQRK